jgi:transcriptional regulator with GAF, ATPase, and Fis domain
MRDYPEAMTAAAREGRLTEAFVSLADSLVSDYDVVDLLHNLIDVSIELLGVTAAGLVLHDPAGAMEVLASSSEETRLLELLQVEDGDGPCLEAYRTSRVVSVGDLSLTPARWPRFQAGAAEYGFVSVHAVPMRLRNETIGALNLFGRRREVMNEQDAKVAQALADVATIAILQERSSRRHAVLSEQLQVALHSRVLIEQAKGVLAQQATVDMDTAFKMLRGHARGHSLRLHDVAQAVVERSLDLSRVAPPT